MRSSSILVAGVLLLAGCSSIIGADFDRPGERAAAPEASQKPAQTPESAPKTVVPPSPSGTCETSCVGWTVEPTSLSGLFAVGGVPGGDVFIGTGFAPPEKTGRLVRSAAGGASWLNDDLAALPGRSIVSIRGLATGEVFAATFVTGDENTPLLRRTAGGWVAESVGEPAMWSITDVFPISNDEIFVACRDTIRHRSQGQWTRENATGDLLWAADSSTVYAIAFGEAPTIFHRLPNTTWELQPTGTHDRVFGIWGSGPNDIYVVGEHGTVLHSAGTPGPGGWTLQKSGTTEHLRAVWGSGPDDVYAVGDGGIILHSVGRGEWTPQPSGTHENLSGVWGSGRDSVYAVGLKVMVRRGEAR